MKTYWYARSIGSYLYAMEVNGKLIHCSEYGVIYRGLFDSEDIIVDKRITLEDKRVVKN